MGEVQKVYQQYSHANFSRGELANALGMSSGSGAFWGKSATLNMYGLIEDVGGSMKVSSLFKGLFQAPEGSPEMKRNALAAIGKPSVFAGLLKGFGSRVPDEGAIALRLEMQGGFNRDRAQEVASAFRSSLSDYELIDASGNLLPPRDGAGAPSAPSNEDEDEDLTNATPSKKAPDVPAGPGSFRVEVPLGPGRKAILALPEDISSADTTKICAIINAYATS
jgi:hypothetical protein